MGGSFEQIRTPIPPLFACAVPIDDRTSLPKWQDRCQLPFECPWGTGVCAQGLQYYERGYRDSIQVQQTHMDTVDYGIYVTSPLKGLDDSLRAVWIRNNSFKEGLVGIMLWGVGLSATRFAVDVAIGENTIWR